MPYSATKLSATRFLVLAPHPDDEIFGCGGALATLCDAKARGVIQICTDGSLGGIAKDGKTLVELRRLESQRALIALGAERMATLAFWDFADRSLSAEPRLAEAIRSAIFSFQPELVFAPSLMEVHPDHFAVAIAAYECWQTAPEAQSFELLMYEIGRPIEANCLVDISTVFERKRKAMQCFESQLAERDYIDVIEGLNRYRSYTLGREVTAAEAYFRLPKPSLAPTTRSVGTFSQLTGLLPVSMRHVLQDLDAGIVTSATRRSINTTTEQINTPKTDLRVSANP